MLITLDVPDHLLTKIDEANDAIRLEPPTWPFEQTSVVKQQLSQEERKKLLGYHTRLEEYNKKKSVNGGKNIRSRSTLVTKILDYVIEDEKLWHELTQI